MVNTLIKKAIAFCLAICAFPIVAQCRQYKIATVAWAGWSPLHVHIDMSEYHHLCLKQAANHHAVFS